MRHLIATMFVSASLFSVSAYAEDGHLHGGDIKVTVSDNQFVVGAVGSEPHRQEGTGYAIFEGDFRDWLPDAQRFVADWLTAR